MKMENDITEDMFDMIDYERKPYLQRIVHFVYTVLRY